MYQPISCDFYDQLEIVIQRQIPSTIVYEKDEEKCTIKGLVKKLEVIDGKEYLMLKTGERVLLHTIFTFNGKRHKEED